MARRSQSTLLSDLVTLAVVYEFGAWALNWYYLANGQQPSMPFDGIGTFFGYPGLTLSEQSTSVDYMAESSSPALATESLTDAAAGGNVDAAQQLEEDEDDGM